MRKDKAYLKAHKFNWRVKAKKCRNTIKRHKAYLKAHSPHWKKKSFNFRKTILEHKVKKENAIMTKIGRSKPYRFVQG